MKFKMFRRFLKRNAGFTLIETLVVVAVFATISTLSLVIFNPKAQLEKGNDAKRQIDLSQIKTSLDAYYNDNNKYPDSLNELISNNYTKTIPRDPSCPKAGSCSNDYVYLAQGSNPQWYVLFSQLKSPEISTPCPYTCTGIDPSYNYCSFEG
ncbi:type II secretion system protein, partial [Candidatus Microgenomates bacterium]